MDSIDKRELLERMAGSGDPAQREFARSHAVHASGATVRKAPPPRPPILSG